MFESEILLQDTREILGAVPVTIGMALLIFLLSVIVGSLFALVEYRRIPVLRELIMVYKIILKGVPMVVVIFLSYFGLPAALQFVYSALGIDANAHMMPNWIILVIDYRLCRCLSGRDHQGRPQRL
jgi:L-cystine transport system permease protein